SFLQVTPRSPRQQTFPSLRVAGRGSCISEAPFLRKSPTYPEKFRKGVVSRPIAGESTKQEDGSIDVAMFGADELMRAAHKRQVLLTDVVHVHSLLARFDVDVAA